MIADAVEPAVAAAAAEGLVIAEIALVEERSEASIVALAHACRPVAFAVVGPGKLVRSTAVLDLACYGGCIRKSCGRSYSHLTPASPD